MKKYKMIIYLKKKLNIFDKNVQNKYFFKKLNNKKQKFPFENDTKSGHSFALFMPSWLKYNY